LVLVLVLLRVPIGRAKICHQSLMRFDLVVSQSNWQEKPIDGFSVQHHAMESRQFHQHVESGMKIGYPLPFLFLSVFLFLFFR